MKLPVPNGLAGTGIWSKTCEQGSRNDGLSQFNTKKPSYPSSSLDAATADYIKT
ncbi:hypothetical protein ACU81Q_10515 [Komagataeibacter melomenusus]